MSFSTSAVEFNEKYQDLGMIQSFGRSFKLLPEVEKDGSKLKKTLQSWKDTKQLTPAPPAE